MLLCASLLACGDDDGSDHEKDATLEVKDYVKGQLEELRSAAQALQKAAPEPDDDGWNADDDKKAVDAMRDAWSDARIAYERVEGSIAVLFPMYDISTDERYDGFIEEEADDDLFDGEGVTGVHAIERILWSNAIPERVVSFEKTLKNYSPAAFPSNEEQAEQYKSGLCQRLVDDADSMLEMFGPLGLQSSTAFRGMIGSMEEQSEKTTLAADGRDESRYAQHTLADMRANLEGARAVYGAFRPWVLSVNGAATTKQIDDGLDEVGDAYEEVDGVALPEVPEGFNPDDPSEADLASPYGKLWSLLNEVTDPNEDDSLVSRMGAAATEMGIPGLEDEE
jgi:iron uptake system component EfeO